MAKKEKNNKKRKTSIGKQIVAYFLLAAMILSVLATAISALAK